MNSELNNIVSFLLTSLGAGIAGTALMTLFMRVIARSGLANVDMIRAIGSIFTRSIENSFGAGIVLHFASGIIFALLYNLAFRYLMLDSLFTFIANGAAIGLAHGFVLSFLLIIAVAEHHPLAQFRKTGVWVAVAHLLGHIIYGTVVGLVCGISAML